MRHMDLERRAVLGGLLALGLPLPALAKTRTLPVPPPGRARRVFSGNSFVLDDDRHVRLGSIEAPRPAGHGQPAQPMADAARHKLAALVESKMLRFTNPAPDKFGRVRAQVFVPVPGAEKPLWVQGTLVARGLARVRTWRDDHALATPLLALESRARQAGTGLWALPYYAVRSPQNLEPAIGSFQIIEGRVLDAVQRRDWVYLNFGADWHKDFTIAVRAARARAFVKAGIRLNRLSGAMVRARGLLRSYNGPVLYLDHPQALEVLKAR